MKTSPWAAWSSSSKDRQEMEVPAGMQWWGAIKEQQHTSEGAGRRFRRRFRRKKQSRRSGGLDWREEDVLGASLNRNPGNYRVQFFSLRFAVSCLTLASVKGARDVLCTQRPSLPQRRFFVSEQPSSPCCPSSVPHVHLSSVLRNELPGRLNPSFSRAHQQETPSIFCPPL